MNFKLPSSVVAQIEQQDPQAYNFFRSEDCGNSQTCSVSLRNVSVFEHSAFSKFVSNIDSTVNDTSEGYLKLHEELNRLNDVSTPSLYSAGLAVKVGVPLGALVGGFILTSSFLSGGLLNPFSLAIIGGVLGGGSSSVAEAINQLVSGHLNLKALASAGLSGATTGAAVGVVSVMAEEFLLASLFELEGIGSVLQGLSRLATGNISTNPFINAVGSAGFGVGQGMFLRGVTGEDVWSTDDILANAVTGLGTGMLTSRLLKISGSNQRIQMAREEVGGAPRNVKSSAPIERPTVSSSEPVSIVKPRQVLPPSNEALGFTWPKKPTSQRSGSSHESFLPMEPVTPNEGTPRVHGPKSDDDLLRIQNQQAMDRHAKTASIGSDAGDPSVGAVQRRVVVANNPSQKPGHEKNKVADVVKSVKKPY